jgi:hypothetical protein
VYAPVVEGFLRGVPVPAPFVTAPAGAYRALCLRAPGGGATGAGPQAGAPGGEGLRVVLLAGEDGAVYVPDLPGPAAGGAAAPGVDGGEPDAADLEATLRRLRLRPSSTSLALRLPAGMTASPAGATGGRVARFTLWASPAYQATGAGGSAVWK